ncbi:hypothetical protein HK102_013817 [Quaeritorhiza haematococci]|nr:hypothetical protein HK102_013817 [Quaeritorhiza haematococci]
MINAKSILLSTTAAALLLAGSATPVSARPLRTSSHNSSAEAELDAAIASLGVRLESFVPTTDDIDISLASNNPDDISFERNHPAMGFLAPDLMGGAPSSNSIELSENSDGLAGGTRDSVHWFENHFGQKFEYNLARLPREFVYNNIWPGDYYPTFLDGINNRGNQEMSPADKYATAFGLDKVQLANGISRLTGIDSMRSFRPPCSQDSDCTSLNDGSRCAKRQGQNEGLCIPTWFGLCHAWAPASILEPEPKCPVTFRGVTFTVNDLKALIVQLYDGSHIRTVFGGNRCNDGAPAVDQHGRYQSFECRDITPDFWHLVLTNSLGRFKTSFVADIDGKAEVWNHPLVSYSYLNPEEPALSLDQGARLINPALNSYSFNPQAVSLKHVKLRYWFMVETQQDGAFTYNGRAQEFVRTRDVEYLLELDAGGNIIGGEWVGDSKTNHPDFVWLPYTRPSDSHSVEGIRYRVVRHLLTLSLSATC